MSEGVRKGIREKNGYFSGRWECEFNYKETGEIKANTFAWNTEQFKGFKDAAIELQKLEWESDANELF